MGTRSNLALYRLNKKDKQLQLPLDRTRLALSPSVRSCIRMLSYIWQLCETHQSNQLTLAFTKCGTVPLCVNRHKVGCSWLTCSAADVIRDAGSLVPVLHSWPFKPLTDQQGLQDNQAHCPLCPGEHKGRRCAWNGWRWTGSHRAGLSGVEGWAVPVSRRLKTWFNSFAESLVHSAIWPGCL